MGMKSNNPLFKEDYFAFAAQCLLLRTLVNRFLCLVEKRDEMLMLNVDVSHSHAQAIRPFHICHKIASRQR